MKKINTKRIAVIGVLTALSIILVMLIHFPLLPPPAAFLEYDPADIPIYIATFMYGPAAGLVITVIASVIQGLTVSSASGLYGILMHIVATGTFVIASSLVYRVRKNYLFLLISLIVGIIVTTAVMIPANLVITPLFMGMPVDVVKGLLVPAIIPFNLLKQCINAAFTAVIFIPLLNAVKKYI